MTEKILGSILILSILFLIITIIVKQNTKEDLKYKIEPYQEFRRGFYFTLGALFIFILIYFILFSFFNIKIINLFG